MKALLFSVIFALAICCALAAFGEVQTLKEYNALAKAAEEKRSHMKAPDADRVLTPVVNGLISENPAIRRRAVEILEGPYLTSGWLAIDHFQRLTWEKLDARGRGMYLWCWAAQDRWENTHPGRPLPESIARDLWTKAAQEPVALPYLKETAALLFHRWRGADHPPAPLGDLLEREDRQRLARQYLSVFDSCNTDMERDAVCWMIVDLHSDGEDRMMEDWYEDQAQPEERVNLLKALNRIVNPGKDDNVVLRLARHKTEGVLQARYTILESLAQRAATDWDTQAKDEAARLLENLEVLKPEQQ